MRGEFLVALRLVDAEGAATKLVQILPGGAFRARDGRPGNMQGCVVDDWRMNASVAARLIAAFDAQGMPLLIDYEHQTVACRDNGHPAPAAGWGVQLVWQDGGLYAVVQWTSQALEYIRADEYRFISPVFEFDPQTGDVLHLLHCALTNFPALTGMLPVTARQSISQESDMKLKPETLALLGLNTAQSDDADAVHGAVAALKATAAAEGSVTADKPSPPDPARYVPVAVLEGLKGELAALRAERNQDAVNALIAQGLNEGKLLPVQEPWARELGTVNMTALKNYLESTPAVAALRGTQTGGVAPVGDGTSGALSEAQREAMRVAGWSADVFKEVQ